MAQHNSGTTQHCHNTTVSQHNGVTTQQCHNSKYVIFQERLLKVLKCYNFLWVQRRHNCSPAASFANCVMTLYLLKVHLKTYLSKPVTQKRQILSWQYSSRDAIQCRTRRIFVRFVGLHCMIITTHGTKDINGSVIFYCEEYIKKVKVKVTLVQALR